MGFSIYDKAGKEFVISREIDLHALQQPLVRERRETHTYPFGTAEIVQIYFSGIYIVYGDVIMHDNRLRMRAYDEPDLVELHFSLAGDGTMENFITQKKYEFKANESFMMYAPEFDGVGEYKKDNYKFFEVHFTTESFLALAQNGSASLMRFAEQVAQKQVSELSATPLPITFAMQSCIREIINCKIIGGMKLLFLQSKCIELLALQVQCYEETVLKTQNTICKTEYDKDCIHFAREYLLENYQQPPSLTELSKIAGTNEFKLKKGFKEVYNNTVFGYLNDFKMELAKEMLASKTKNITEVAQDLGYSSVHHFSNAFKKKFGLSPSKV